MNPEYFKTRFRTTENQVHFPEEFVIITAYPTTGETWIPSKIEEADFELFPQTNRKFDPDRNFWLSLLSNFCVIVNLRVFPFQHTFNHIPTTPITS